MADLYFYNQAGEKNSITVDQLKTLVRLGLIVPDTIIENKKGQKISAKLLADKIIGLEFKEGAQSSKQSSCPFEDNDEAEEYSGTICTTIGLWITNTLQRATNKQIYCWSIAIIAGIVLAVVCYSGICGTPYDWWFSLLACDWWSSFVVPISTMFLSAWLVWGLILAIFFMVVAIMWLIVAVRQKSTPSKTFCTNCGKPVSGWADTCPSCGAVPHTHKKFCRGCGATLTPEQVVCVQCKTPIKQSTGGWLILSLVWGVIFGLGCIYFGLTRENGLFVILGIIVFVAGIGRFLVDLVKMVKK